MPRRPAAALLLFLGLAACGAPGPTGAPQPATTRPAATEPAPVEPAPSGGAASDADTGADAIEAARAALEAGDLETAHAALSAELAARRVDEARAELADGRPGAALSDLDDALEVAPDAPEALALRGHAYLALGDDLAARGSNGLYVEAAYQDAERAFRAAPRNLDSVLGRLDAAWRLNDGAAALRHAREASRLAAERGPDAPPLDARARLLIARGFYLGFAQEVQARANGAPRLDDDGFGALRESTVDALDALVGEAPDDPATWNLLADFYLFDGDGAAALDMIRTGLSHLPADEALLERLALLARQRDGYAGAVDELQRFVDRHPESGPARFLLGRERFELALATFPAEDAEPAAFDATEQSFAAAEEAFAAARERLPADDARVDAALGWQVVSRTAVGWARYWAGDTLAARDAFVSTEALRERGIEWKLEGRLESGVLGMKLCYDRLIGEGRVVQAAEVARQLHAIVPADLDAANNAGLFSRDAAAQLEQLGRELCRASRGEPTPDELLAELRIAAGVPEDEVGTPAERDRYAAAADGTLERARATMRAAADAYAAAEALAPDSVRIVNDTALIEVYHLHRDLDAAEARLHRSIELAEAQTAEPGFDPEAQRDLVVAWGDAAQNLGVLHLVHRDDAAAARPWFERSVEIDPEDRADVTEIWLPLCDTWDSDPTSREHPRVRNILRWGEPCL